MFKSYHSDFFFMLLQETVTWVGDNSGLIFVKVIKNLGGFYRRYARLGCNIIVAARKKRNELLIKDKIFFAVLLSVCKKIVRLDGSYINFKKNVVMIFNFKQRSKFMGKRLRGPVAYELKNYRLFNIMFFAKYVI